MNQSMNDARTLISLITGYRATALVTVAARLRLADHLAEGPRTLVELAAATGAREDRLEQVLRALVAIEVLEDLGGQTFGLTSVGQLLRRDHPQTQYHAAMYFGVVNAKAFDGLLDGLSTEQCPFEHQFNTDFYSFLEANPDLAEYYNTVIALRGAGKMLAQLHDFSDARTIVDIGGGQGMLLAEILTAYTQARGILQELPYVLAQGTPSLEHPTVAHRYRIVQCSFFDSVPDGGDIYILSRVLANWNDRQAEQILRNCREAMHVRARLLIFEMMMPERVTPGSFAPLGDVNAMVSFGGRVRTRSEFEGMLNRAGFSIIGAIPVHLGQYSDWTLLVTTGELC